jgi:hypothetical protein
MNTRWFYTVTLGEFIGFIIPSIVGVTTVYFHKEGIPQAIYMVIAGMGEGCVLGYAQSRIIKKVIPQINPKQWILATTLAAGVAWLIGMLPSTLYPFIKNISLVLLIPSGITLACILLLSIGYAQYIVLRPFVKNAGIWIWGNILAWVAGLGVLTFFMSIAPDGYIPTLFFSIIGGLGMAATMAAITGTYLTRIK